MVSEPNAVVLNIQRLSTEDGPGIRTTVFFKGCSLACDWCHNPESLSRKPQLQWFASRCLGCRLCVAACPNKVLSFSKTVWKSTARAAWAAAPARRNAPRPRWSCSAKRGNSRVGRRGGQGAAYFQQSGGGVTVSGGEPTMQADSSPRFSPRCAPAVCNTALDTCGQCSPEALAAILPHADMVLFDLKLIDAAAHKEHTGASNKKILENLLLVRDFMRKHENPASWDPHADHPRCDRELRQPARHRRMARRAPR
jgi:pyruvate formate lyase activating enzyme